MCDVAMLDSTMDSIRTTLSSQTEVLDQIRSKYDELREKFDVGVAGYCIDRYCGAELDFATPGDRGLGRISEHIPRYGAYFRKSLARMDSTDLARVKELLVQHVLGGYLAHALLTEDPLEESKYECGEGLFETWLPGVYSSDPGEMGPSLRQFLSAFDAGTYGKHKAFRARHGMKGGGVFTADKSDLIIAYYPLAGFGLRTTEVGRWK